MGLALCVGKILSGQLYDRLGGLKTNYCIFLSYLAGLLLCATASANHIILAFLAITVFSFGVSVCAVSPAVWAGDLAAPETYPKLLRMITMSYTFGMLVSGPIPGILADRTGSYVPAYLLFALLLLSAMLLVQSVYHTLERRR
jgi:predicted MFS family arabinose efflux permease